jgi:maltokinase
MLRSFDYAAHSVLLQTGADTLDRAEQWVARNRAAFLSGYGFVPDEGATIVLSAYEIDKAVYEVVYELHHRPDWVTLPLRALERLVS